MKNTAAIVLPTDLSTDTEAGYPFAIRFARTLERPLRLLLVESPFAAHEQNPFPEYPLSKLNEDRLGKVERHLSASGVTVTGGVRLGFPAREILAELERAASMVVITLHGQVGRPHRMLGSVAGKVIRHSPVATLVVRSPMVDRPIANIAMSLDFSELDTGAFADALGIARGFGATLELFHVIGTPMTPLIRADLDVAAVGVPVSSGELIAAAESEMLRHVEAAAAAGVEATSMLLHSDDPVEAIAQRIQETDPDLAIMAAHGRTGFSRLILGSVTEEVVRRSTRPVLVLKPPRTYLETLSPT